MIYRGIEPSEVAESLIPIISDHQGSRSREVSYKVDTTTSRRADGGKPMVQMSQIQANQKQIRLRKMSQTCVFGPLEGHGRQGFGKSRKTSGSGGLVQKLK